MVISWPRLPGDEELSPEVQERFARFREKMGSVPNVARAFALSPRFLLWFRYYGPPYAGGGSPLPEGGGSHGRHFTYRTLKA